MEDSYVLIVHYRYRSNLYCSTQVEILKYMLKYKSKSIPVRKQCILNNREFDAGF